MLVNNIVLGVELDPPYKSQREIYKYTNKPLTPTSIRHPNIKAIYICPK